MKLWLGNVVDRRLNLRSAGREFDSRPSHCRVATLAQSFTHMFPAPLKLWLLRLLLLSNSCKLVLSVAMSIIDRQAAFLQAENRSVFKGLKFDSLTRSHVCLGRPTGRLQSGGGFLIATETAWWWSWMGCCMQCGQRTAVFYLLPYMKVNLIFMPPPR